MTQGHVKLTTRSLVSAANGLLAPAIADEEREHTLGDRISRHVAREWRDRALKAEAGVEEVEQELYLARELE
jgi:hypothetical protein